MHLYVFDFVSLSFHPDVPGAASLFWIISSVCEQVFKGRGISKHVTEGFQRQVEVESKAGF